MDILTMESIDSIKKLFLENEDILNKPFKKLVEENNLTLIEGYSFDHNINLVISNEGKQENNDYTNAGLVYQALPGLSPAEATDERLWVTLCLNQFRAYMNARWPKIDDGKHYFVSVNGSIYRNLTRNNGISRLWWTHYNSKKITSDNKDLTTFFFNDIDRRQQAIERTTSTSSKNVLKSIFEIVNEQNNTGKKYNRDHYRDFMKKVSFIGKRKSLPSLDEKNLKKNLLKLYLEN